MEVSLELRTEVQAGKENLMLYFLLAPSLFSAKLPLSSLIHSLHFLPPQLNPLRSGFCPCHFPEMSRAKGTQGPL